MCFSDALDRHRRLFSQLDALNEPVEKLVNQIRATLRVGGKVIFMGNGGSAADAQHLAAEFVVRYKEERAPLAALALTVDSSILTAHSNDYEFDTVFSRQMHALCRKHDLVIGLSTSGNSNNIIDATKVARDLGATTWAWTGAHGGKLLDVTDHCLRVPSNETARIQEAHIFIGHVVCEALDQSL